MSMMDKVPENNPAAPIPETARPRINIFELIATPHRSEPRRKMLTKVQ
jgi:hypothetical protein